MGLREHRRETTVRIPKVFYDDCVDCEVEYLPPIVKELKNHYVISKIRDEFAGSDTSSTYGKQMNNLISRAIYYAEACGFDMTDPWSRGLLNSARATLRALHKADVLTEAEIEECLRAYWKIFRR